MSEDPMEKEIAERFKYTDSSPLLGHDIEPCRIEIAFNKYGMPLFTCEIHGRKDDPLDAPCQTRVGWRLADLLRKDKIEP